MPIDRWIPGLRACRAVTARSCAAVLSAGMFAAAAAASHAAPAAAMQASAPAGFSPGSVPVSAKPLPAFPYLEFPEQLKPRYKKTKEENFDAAYFIAGATLRRVEGRVGTQRYMRKDSGLSGIEALRNYDNAIKALGGVRIDTVKPKDKAFIEKHGGDRYDVVVRKLGGGDSNPYAYAAYLIRTPENRVWIGVNVGLYVTVTILEEKQMEQSVGLTKADEMKAALDKDGYVALYINFDTDKAALREDGKPAVDEIIKLLKAHPGLKISIEGHTDNTGDARRNKTLSEQRAATIATALKASGIDAGRLKSAGFGADRPVADNRTEDGRAKNRRVELVKS